MLKQSYIYPASALPSPAQGISIKMAAEMEGVHSQPQSVDYEQIRNARIEENKKRMQQLGLPNLSQSLSMQLSAKRSRPFRPIPESKLASTPAPSRRSSRLQNVTPVSYVEIPPAWKESSDSRSIRPFQGGIQPEIYTEEHEKLLGSCEAEWVLFQDGYGPNGNRIYDSVRGKTCHQCRQKTLGLRTNCSKCSLLQGQFCGDCLYMRYGENILEVLKKPGWVCPVCRGICNCSFCRQKKGWAPTGTLHRYAKSLGYKSVAHYLILSQKSSTKAESAGAVSDDCHIIEDKGDVSPNSTRSLAFTSASEITTESNSPIDTTKEENNSLSNGARRFLSFTSASITTTESNSPMTKEENNSLPDFASSKSELGSDCQMKSDPSISHTNTSCEDILVQSKTSPDSAECSEKQCDCGDVEKIPLAGINDHSERNTKRISSRSKAYVRGGIAQRLRPRVTTKESS